MLDTTAERTRLALQRPDLLREAAWVNGEWVTATETITVTNPANGRPIGTIPALGATDPQAAAAAAAAAFPAFAEDVVDLEQAVPVAPITVIGTRTQRRVDDVAVSPCDHGIDVPADQSVVRPAQAVHFDGVSDAGRRALGGHQRAAGERPASVVFQLGLHADDAGASAE